MPTDTPNDRPKVDVPDFMFNDASAIARPAPKPEPPPTPVEPPVPTEPSGDEASKHPGTN
jgi:hypothetical protein